MKRLFFIPLTFSLIASAPLFDEENHPSQELLELLEVTKTRHKGTFKSILGAVEKAWSQGEKERWELDNRHSKKKQHILSIAHRMGFFDDARASKDHYTYAGIKADLQNITIARLQFLIDEWKRGIRFDHLIFFAGFRKIDPRREPLAHHPSMPQTESDLALLIYDYIDMPDEMRALPVIFINAPAAPGRTRATTASSTLKWVNSKPKPGSCLMVSSQPYVQYQHNIVSMFLPDDISLETIGCKARTPPSPELILDIVAKTILWSSIK